MKPTFQIISGGSKDITNDIRNRLLSLELTDESEDRNDMLTLKLDDRAPHIELPPAGTELAIAIGYEGKMLHKKGRFVVSFVELKSPPFQVVICATGANVDAVPSALGVGPGFKSPRTRSWHEVTIGGMVASMAAEHGYIPAVSEWLADIHIPHIDQVAESDMGLLNRLGVQYDAVGKAANGVLLFVPRDESRNVRGRLFPDVEVNQNDLSSFRVKDSSRNRYSAVEAAYHDVGAAETVPVTAGSGSPVYKLRNTYPTRKEAEAAARAKLAHFRRRSATLSATMPGTPELMAERHLIISAARNGVAGRWIMTRVRHIIDKGGYRTEVEAGTPKD